MTGPEVAQAARTALAPWESYYVITGGAAAALTGLQFVVQTLIAQRDVAPADAAAPTGGASEHATAAFGSPTVVHFAAALLLSAGLSAPWPSLGGLRLALLAAGVGGLGYAGVIFRRTRRQTAYRPVLEDWVWHVALPAAAYGGVAAAAGLVRNVGAALFVVAAMTLLLLCVGIHNAWDTVAYLTSRPQPTPGRPPDALPPSAPAPVSERVGDPDGQTSGPGIEGRF